MWDVDNVPTIELQGSSYEVIIHMHLIPYPLTVYILVDWPLAWQHPTGTDTFPALDLRGHILKSVQTLMGSGL